MNDRPAPLGGAPPFPAQPGAPRPMRPVPPGGPRPPPVMSTKAPTLGAPPPIRPAGVGPPRPGKPQMSEPQPRPAPANPLAGAGRGLRPTPGLGTAQRPSAPIPGRPPPGGGPSVGAPPLGSGPPLAAPGGLQRPLARPGMLSSQPHPPSMGAPPPSLPVQPGAAPGPGAGPKLVHGPPRTGPPRPAAAGPRPFAAPLPSAGGYTVAPPLQLVNGHQQTPSSGPPDGKGLRSAPPLSAAIAPPPGTSAAIWSGQTAGGPSAAVLAEQLESIPLGPEAPGAPDSTDIGLFPRPLIQDGTVGPTEEQLKLPAAPFEAGTCDPRIMRPTVAAVPNSMSLKSSWHLPLAIILQPLRSFGQSTPVVDGTQPHSIMRCNTCRSYMNPFNKWLSGGSSFRCCICGSEQAVANAGCASVGGQDVYARPELSAGSVEFIAPADYTVRPPVPPSYFFVIDVSQPAIACGGVAAACIAIISTLDTLTQRNSATKIGLLTYDSSVHFYNLSASLPAAQMMVVADIDDPFPPLPDEHFVTLESARGILDTLLTALPTMFASSSNLDSAMAAALQAAFRTISHLGGKLMLFTATAPTIGAVRTKPRDMPAQYNTDREPAMRQAGDAFFRSFAAECIQYQICVDVFAMSAQYCDLFSLALLPRSTGGSLHFYPAFNAARDGTKLTHELVHSLQHFTGWEAVMRMRCSKGLRISTFHGHLHVRSNDLVVLPSVNEDSTYVAQLVMEDSVLADPHVYVQCALLYTSPSSERRIRVHTIRLPVVATAYELFNHVDAVATATALAKLGVDKALTSRLDETRDVVQQKVVAQLREFKSVHQGHFRKPAHLAYPRTLRHLLPWVHGLLRGNALRGAADVSPDERCAVMSFLLVASPDLTILAAYPAVFALHVPGWGGETADGGFALPPTVPASVQYLDPAGAYLVDAGYLSFVWVGGSAPRGLVQELFGAGVPHSAEGGDLVRLGETCIDNGAPCRLGDLTRQVLATRRRRPVWPLCFTVVQGSPMEGYFAVHFVEDRLPPNCPGYHEFLVHLHKSLSLR